MASTDDGGSGKRRASVPFPSCDCDGDSAGHALRACSAVALLALAVVTAMLSRW